MTLIGKQINVLDGGFVRLVDVMGDDTAVVQAARVSYGAGTKTPSDDRSLIRYLMRHRHTSPFEMCEIKLHVRLPIFVARQWIRHRTASVNELSLRYSEAEDDNWHNPATWRSQSETNRQGSGDDLKAIAPFALTGRYKLAANSAYAAYQQMLLSGVAREQARIVLPLSMYTEWYWKQNLHNLLHFLELRLDPHAQQEIRVYAEAVAEIVAAWVPVTWEAFQDYRLNARTFSAQEMAILQVWASTFPIKDAKNDLNAREQREFKDKLGVADAEA